MAGQPPFDDVTGEVDGNALRLVIDGKSRLSLLLDTIADANQTLRLFFYIFSNDEIGLRVRDAMIAACERGVRVWLFVDGFGSKETTDGFFEPLQQAGAIFGRFNSRFGTRYLLRNHQKMVIADSQVAIIGGANVARTYFEVQSGQMHWHDLALRVEGPAVERLAAYFDSLMRWITGKEHRLRGITHVLARRSEKSGNLRWLFSGPFRRMSPLTIALKHDLEWCRQIDMMQAYFSPNWGMLRRIGRVERRGGSFRLISSSVSDNRVTVGASRHCFSRMLRKGASVFEWQNQPLHAKLVIADNAVYVGSANFDMRSLFINGEVMLRIDDASFAAKVRASFEAQLASCHEITSETLKAMAGPLTRLRWLASYFLVSTFDFSVTRRFGLKRRRRNLR